MTARQLIEAALRTLGVGATESPTNAELQTALEDFQIMLRSWSLENLMTYFIEEENFACSAGTAQYTIGSGGTFNTTRPVSIVGAFTRTTAGVDYPLEIVDEKQFREVAVKSDSGTPAWLWYNPEYPLGLINLYQTPNGADDLYLNTKKPLTEPTKLTSNVQFDPAYDKAIRYGLAMELAPSYGIEPSPLIINQANKAKRTIKSYNAGQQVASQKLEMFRLSRRWSINAG